MLGYPDRAAQLREDCEAHARRRGHPFDLGWALISGAHVLDLLGEPNLWLRRIEEAERLAGEDSLSYFVKNYVPCFSGVALVGLGQTAEGVARLRKGVAVREEGGAWDPDLRSVLGEGMAQLGDLDGALDLIDEIIAQIETPGWGERWYYAETLRIKGWLLALKGDLAGAERAYLASLDWARQQQAKSWELRTATSYARLLCDQRRAGEARDLLAPIYGWFTEGFGTKDLKDAKALLVELETACALAPAVPA